jgi:hypothetical protein
MFMLKYLAAVQIRIIRSRGMERGDFTLGWQGVGASRRRAGRLAYCKDVVLTSLHPPATLSPREFAVFKQDLFWNDWLKACRKVSFEAEVATLLATKGREDVERLQSRAMLALFYDMNGHNCAAPYAPEDRAVFLTPIFSNRDMKSRYRAPLFSIVHKYVTGRFVERD